tara:strand:+ start:926 stop:1147 length:222 start_codon:yes stop_codon:yes gene_type:complete
MIEDLKRDKEFFENKSKELDVKIKKLQFELAELQKSNSELLERCKKLASRQPSWPKGYRPQRYYYNNNKNANK